MAENTENTTKYEFDVYKWLEKYKAEKKDNANKLAMSGLVDFLKSKGWKHIKVFYEGAGDSGEAYEAEGYKSNKDWQISNKDQCAEYLSAGTWKDGQYTPDKDKWEKASRNQKELSKDYDEFRKIVDDEFKVGDELSYMLSDCIAYDWYNNEGGGGHVHLDLCNDKINVNGYQYEQTTRDCSVTVKIERDESN